MGIFPQEILDYILGFISDDITALKQCGLSSMCLLRTSRKHRFWCVTIKSTHRRDAYIDISSFCDLTQYQPFAVNIRMVQMDMTKYINPNEEHRPSTPTTLTLTIANLSRVTAHLTSLQFLSIQYAELLLDAPEYPLPSSHLTLHSLCLQKCHHVHKCIPPLLQLFRPRKLELHQGIDPVQFDNAINPLLLLLDFITPSEDAEEPVLSVEKVGDFPLQFLGAYGDLDTESIRALVSAVSHTSIHTIHVNGDFLSSRRFRDLDFLFHAATALQTLNVGTFLPWSEGLEGRWTSLLSSTKLISLELTVADWPDLGGWDPAIDVLMAAPESVEIINVLIILYPTSTMEIPSEDLREGFRRLQKLRLVKFTWKDDSLRTGPSIEDTIKVFDKAFQSLKPGVVQHEIWPYGKTG
ncbi:hypothetical protein QCA50_010792 [Cerrena zonata]|uniref:F-box domain-containing protein n=1 Tax=Cerrena zonata TaxID=2478898 RepID=A0AAW0G386_9APHY